MNNGIKSLIANISYNMHLLGNKLTGKSRLHVMSIDETIRQIKDHDLSVVRFGDAEISLVRGLTISYQKSSAELSDALKEVLSSDEEGLMVAIPDIFEGNIEQYVPTTQHFWKDHLLFNRSAYYENCHSGKAYGNAYVSRCYMTLSDRSKSAEWFTSIKDFWKDRKITVIEGAGTHTGVTNDLLDTATEVERIICPSTQAYDYYQEILDACCQLDQNRMILISLGPSAKLLGLALFRKGYRILDIGNLDMEYEWFLAGVTNKTEIPKHHVLTIEANKENGYTQYLSEIVQRIGC